LWIWVALLFEVGVYKGNAFCVSNQSPVEVKVMTSSDSSIDIKGTPYSFYESQMPFLKDLSKRVQKMRAEGRLSPDVLGNIRKYFRIKNIYHSNAIAGNILSVGETRQVVELGLTITGRPLKDQAEAKNLQDALDFLEELASSTETPITEADLRQIHYLVLRGIDDKNAGKYRNEPVEIGGSEYSPPDWESVPPQMEDFGKWLASVSINENSHGLLDAILYAAAAHTWFVYVHPFVDGNGRVARLLMNLILMRYGYPISIITKEDRMRYYDALEISQSSDLTPFIALVIECIDESLEEYEEAAKEQKEQQEWAAALATRFSQEERIRSQNEYEVWKSAMELLRNYFRQCVELLVQSPENIAIKLYFKDFGELAWEKYLSLKQGKSAKRTWFFRIDFVRGDKSARYLFFFGSSSPKLREASVTLHLAREDPPRSFNYERLEHITMPNVPNIVEIGYFTDKECFATNPGRGGPLNLGKIEDIGKKFIENVMTKHFQS